jgi:hypothetical protein
VSRHVKWQALSAFFEQKREEGVSFHTIQAWMALGMPHLRPSPHRLWFDSEACWEWYVERFSVGKEGSR